MTDQAPPYPRVHPLGESAMLVEFAPHLTEAANRAAIAFRAAVDRQAAQGGWPGIAETSVTLKSVLIRFDPDLMGHDRLAAALHDLLAGQDWLAAALPPGRRLWRVPAALGGAEGPQLPEMADLMGLSEAAAIADLAATRLRVLTLGFAPGQPYLGRLGPAWDIPRQTQLTPMVPRGAIVAAVRQIVLFTVATQTGWRQIGLTAFEGFRPDADPPFALAPGDELLFEPVDGPTLRRWQARAAAGTLAATAEPIP